MEVRGIQWIIETKNQKFKASFLQYLQTQMNFNSSRRADEDWLEKKAPHFKLADAGYPAFGHLTESEKIVKKIKD